MLVILQQVRISLSPSWCICQLILDSLDSWECPEHNGWFQWMLHCLIKHLCTNVNKRGYLVNFESISLKRSPTLNWKARISADCGECLINACELDVLIRLVPICINIYNWYKLQSFFHWHLYKNTLLNNVIPNRVIFVLKWRQEWTVLAKLMSRLLSKCCFITVSMILSIALLIIEDGLPGQELYLLFFCELGILKKSSIIWHYLTVL